MEVFLLPFSAELRREYSAGGAFRLLFFYASLIPCRKFTATSRAAPYSFLPVCAVFVCVQITVSTRVWDF